MNPYTFKSTCPNNGNGETLPKLRSLFGNLVFSVKETKYFHYAKTLAAGLVTPSFDALSALKDRLSAVGVSVPYGVLLSEKVQAWIVLVTTVELSLSSEPQTRVPLTPSVIAVLTAWISVEVSDPDVAPDDTKLHLG